MMAARDLFPKAAATALCLLAVLLSASAARADYGIDEFTGEVARADGSTETQAGAHPFRAGTTIRLKTVTGPLGYLVADGGDSKDIDVELPAGFAGNPLATPRCSWQQISDSDFYGRCPLSTQVGVMWIQQRGQEDAVPVYNMVPGPGFPAQFAFAIGNVVIPINTRVRRDGTYGVTIASPDISQTLTVTAIKVQLWGVPADPAHNSERGEECLLNTLPEDNCPTDAPAIPFISLPTDCSAGPLTTTVRAASWNNPGVFATASFDHDVNGTPLAVEGCERLPFRPSFEAEPTTAEADAPAGFRMTFGFPQEGLLSPEGLAASPLRTAVVTFPDGMTISPSAADGLQACSDAQLAAIGSDPFACPSAAKIGSVTASTPLLEKPIEGGIYVGSQLSGDPSSGQMFRVFLRLLNEERGIDVRLPGQIRVDPQTGQVKAVFQDNPQLPVSSIDLRLKAGPRAPLATPTSCGTKTTTAELTSWAGRTVVLSDSFSVPCPAGGRFAPDLLGGSVNPLAGSTSPFVVQIRRADREQLLDRISIHLPRGLTAYLKGVPYCPDAAIAASAGKSGLEELASPSCGLASRIGKVQIGAGAGSPYFVDGTVYLAGPYKGAPLSLAVITPAVAGPFDVGTVAVRAALEVNPRNAEITAVSDPLPRVVGGIPLRLRSVAISIDRPRFSLNPTSCEAQALEGTLTSTLGAVAKSSSRYQAASCERLGFDPKLSFRYKGKTNRGAHPAVTATLKARKGDANIGKAVVTLPRTQFLEQGHIRTICTRVQYAADNCPKGSVYGYAKAWTPLLDQPLQGPVYLRSSNNTLPDLVADLDGQIDIELSGRIDSVDERMRVSFGAVPDAPVSKFVLRMQGGRKGLLVNNTELCRAKPRARAVFTGQNGKRLVANPLVRIGCGKK